MGQWWLRSQNRGPTFMRRRGTSCMLPRSRAGEMVGRATFDRKTNMNLSDLPSKTCLAHQLPPESWEVANVEELLRACLQKI